MMRVNPRVIAVVAAKLADEVVQGEEAREAQVERVAEVAKEEAVAEAQVE